MIPLLILLTKTMRGLKLGEQPPADLAALKAAALASHPSAPALIAKHANFKKLFEFLASAVWDGKKLSEAQAEFVESIKMNGEVLAKFDAACEFVPEPPAPPQPPPQDPEPPEPPQP